MEQRRRRNQQVEPSQVDPQQAESPQQPEQKKIKLWKRKRMPSGNFMIIRDGFRHD